MIKLVIETLLQLVLAVLIPTGIALLCLMIVTTESIRKKIIYIAIIVFSSIFGVLLNYLFPVPTENGQILISVNEIYNEYLNSSELVEDMETYQKIDSEILNTQIYEQSKTMQEGIYYFQIGNIHTSCINDTKLKRNTTFKLDDEYHLINNCLYSDEFIYDSGQMSREIFYSTAFNSFADSKRAENQKLKREYFLAKSEQPIILKNLKYYCNISKVFSIILIIVFVMSVFFGGEKKE